MNSMNAEVFKKFSKNIFSNLELNETLTLNLSAEETSFNRLSKAKIRQSTFINQAFLEGIYIKGEKTLTFTMPYTGTIKDEQALKERVSSSRELISDLPDDPYIVKPQSFGETIEENLSELPSSSVMLEEILKNADGLDLAGVFTCGDIVRATTNNLGQFHWFKTRNFSLDYSLYNDLQKAVKSLFAGSVWDGEKLKQNISKSSYQLSLMNKPSRKIVRGDYRVYLAPSAVAELLGTLSWGGLSMAAHQRGNGSFKDLWTGKKKLSEMFSLTEDFSLGLAPRFNSSGEVAAPQLVLIEKGQFKNFFISTRTANEYKLESNFAEEWEAMRSPKVNSGQLDEKDVLKTLDTGIYISDLHYLNWSDRESARVTGMTRYACFWVENGEIICPIEDLRFDESYYKIFGHGLEAVTSNLETITSTGTYFQRDLGGSQVPGIIVNQFTFTL